MDGDQRAAAESIISAISRQLALARGRAIDEVIEAGIADVARAVGADGATLMRTGEGSQIEFLHSWFDPVIGPLPPRSGYKADSYDWVSRRLRQAGPQVIDMTEILARSGPPWPPSAILRVGLIGTFAGEGVVGTLCLYYRTETPLATAETLAPFQVLGDILLGAVARRDAELALEASEDRYRTIVESASDGIGTADADYRITFASQRLADMLGWTVEDLVGRNVLDLVLPADREEVRQHMPRRQEGMADRVEIRFQHRDGSPVHVRVSASAHLDPHGGFEGSMALIQDITEERRLQAELAGARRLEIIGQLAGGVAHDINNALTVIQVNASKGLRISDGEVSTLFDEIAASSQRAADVARQLLAFARREPSQPRSLDLTDLARRSRAVIERLAGEHITIDLDCADDTWPAFADPLQVERVLFNLVANSRDAMPDGGTVYIRLTNCSRAVSTRCEGGEYVALQVQDTGCGMDEETLSHAFEPFFTTKADRGGTGLGLASAFGAMQQLGGAIEIDSEGPGRGTTVTLLFRRAFEPPERIQTDQMVIASAKAHYTILCVEDVAPLRRAIADAMREAGYEVIAVGDGEEAVKRARRGDTTVDALVTDVVLPHQNGYAVARQLRADRPDLPVLYLSGYDRPQELERALVEPHTGFLAKPFTSTELLGELQRLLAVD